MAFIAHYGVCIISPLRNFHIISQPIEIHQDGLFHTYRLASVQIGGLDASLQKCHLNVQSTEICMCRNL